MAAQHLAGIYQNGVEGMIEKDEKKAFELIEWSAEQSLLPSHSWISDAPSRLATWYYFGNGPSSIGIISNTRSNKLC
jgi:TPR repeat protein